VAARDDVRRAVARGCQDVAERVRLQVLAHEVGECPDVPVDLVDADGDAAAEERRVHEAERSTRSEHVDVGTRMPALQRAQRRPRRALFERFAR